MSNPLDEAISALAQAKITEAVAKDARIKAEDAVIALMPKKDKGSVSKRGDEYKAAVTYGINRSVDGEALAAIKRQISPELFDQAIRYKPEVIEKGFTELKDSNPEAYALLAQAITSKPAKPQVAIERLKAKNADNYELAA